MTVNNVIENTQRLHNRHKTRDTRLLSLTSRVFYLFYYNLISRKSNRVNNGGVVQRNLLYSREKGLEMHRFRRMKG